MIRRVVSTLLFVVGAWMLTTELVGAFLDVLPGIIDNAGVIGIFALFAGIPLVLGVWASPGRRWEELGLTILISTGIALFCCVSMAALLMDPGFRQFMPPIPRIELAPAIGVINLLAVGALGWLLYRPARRRTEGGQASSPA